MQFSRRSGVTPVAEIAAWMDKAWEEEERERGVGGGWRSASNGNSRALCLCIYGPFLFFLFLLESASLPSLRRQCAPGPRQDCTLPRPVSFRSTYSHILSGSHEQVYGSIITFLAIPWKTKLHDAENKKIDLQNVYFVMFSQIYLSMEVIILSTWASSFPLWKIARHYSSHGRISKTQHFKIKYLEYLMGHWKLWGNV